MLHNFKEVRCPECENYLEFILDDGYLYVYPCTCCINYQKSESIGERMKNESTN